MDNVFITQHFDWSNEGPWRVRLVNRILRRLGFTTRFVAPGQTGSMTNAEQRINMFHLVMQVLAYGVEGDLVEVGTFRGSSAALMRTVADQFDPGRELHVYDTFAGSSADELRRTFGGLGLRPPVVHPGDLRATLPGELPGRLCFAHIDLGPGESAEGHERSVRHSLETVYPRLARGAVCLLADYCQPDVYDRPGYRRPHTVLDSGMWHLYPHVKRAADDFLRDKPETVYYLYASDFSHGFFRKA